MRGLAEEKMWHTRFEKIKEHLPFCKEFSTLCTEIEFLLNVLPNFDRGAALGD